MALAQVLQPGPEGDPLKGAEIEILDDLYYGPEAAEPGPGDIRINRNGRITGHLILSRRTPIRFN